MAKECYELTDAHINDIIKRTFPVSQSVPISPMSFAKVVPDPSPHPDPATPIACEKKMVKRISTIYQQMQTTSSIYKKYGGDSGDDDVGEDATGVGAIDAGACIMKLSKSISESIQTPIRTSNSKSNYKFFPTPKMPGTGIMHNNQLLWCIYVAVNGRAAFDTMHNAFVTETEFKYATVDAMRIQKMRIKTQFKRYKLSMPNFEAELISSKKLDILGMMALALCNNQNILYIDNRMYYEIISTDDSDTMTVIEKIKNRYCVYDNAKVYETLQMCRDTLWKMESIITPIKSVSHYKLSELQDIYNRLGCNGVEFDSKKRATKPELYAAIMNNIA
jgi:hypothetical protein